MIAWISLAVFQQGYAATQPVQEQASAQMVARMIEALADERERFHKRAMQALVRVGAACVPDLRLLARDSGPVLRVRIAMVAGRIADTEATALLVQLATDDESDVREVVALMLGQHKTEASLQTLGHLVQDENTYVRESAALGLGFFGDARAIRLLAHSYVRQTVPAGALLEEELRSKRARAAMREALFLLCRQPENNSYISTLLQSMTGEPLHILIQATYDIGDPRLCLPLAHILDRQVDMKSQRLAVVALRANGDSRCLEVLCRIAAGGFGPQEESVATLAQLTGHRADAGSAWVLWWRNHKEQVQRMGARDMFIAALHDVKHAVTASEMQQFSVEELSDIINGILGAGAQTWPALAWRALRVDDAERWTAYLLQRYAEEADTVQRIGLICILGELGDPVAFEALRTDYQRIDASMRQMKKSGQQRSSSERLALAECLGIQ